MKSNTYLLNPSKLRIPISPKKSPAFIIVRTCPVSLLYIQYGKTNHHYDLFNIYVFFLYIRYIFIYL